MVIVDYSNSKSQNIFPYIYELKSKGVKVLDINYFYEYVYKKVSLDSVNYSWFFKEVKADAKIYEFIKRIIDISLCVPVFLIWLFLHPWVKYVIEKEDAGDVYSIQERLGRYGKKIYIKKYRTMSYTDNGEWLEQSQNKVTEVGKFLRRTRIDELPQIFAVLKGELSFIGPRTDIVNLGQKLASEIDHYNLRYSVTPGLSGWAQVNMNYQPRTVEDSTERLRYDLYYVKHRSVIFDIIIILKTIKTVLSREGS
jgi:lipopolysaccharide/colanic/teichoic acid biosynthesis glycosyltransferase